MHGPSLSITLTGMWGNADLILADSAGQGIASSRNASTSSERIEVELAGGVYYVGVQARSFWGTHYQLDLSADLAEPAPPAQSPSESSGADNAGQETITAFSDVPYFGSHLDWNVNAVNAPEAWAAGYTGQGVTVAVVDTGVDLDHPDLVNNIFVNPGEIAGNGIDDDQNGYVDDVNGYDFVSVNVSDPGTTGNSWLAALYILSNPRHMSASDISVIT